MLPRVLVGLPHPVSNIRPVIGVYARRGRLAKQSIHPYPTEEFDSSQALTHSVGNYGTPEWLLEDNVRRTHEFWYDSNTRFNAAKNAIIDSHSCLDYTNESSHQAALESALSRLYRGWLNQERKGQRRFTKDMYIRTFRAIMAWKGMWLSRWV